MNVEGITRMSVRAFALAVLEAAGLQKKEYGDNGARLRYLYMESPNGNLVVRFGNVSSIRCLKLHGRKQDRDWFQFFKSHKEKIVKQSQLDFLISYFGGARASDNGASLGANPGTTAEEKCAAVCGPIA